MKNKLAAFASALAQKPNDPLVLEMDLAAQEVVEDYFLTWLRTRIKHNKTAGRKISDDEIYNAIIRYAVSLNSSFFYARLWSESGIRESIWEPLESNQDLLDFVYRGASMLYARVFGRSTDTANLSAMALGKHLADSLTVMSSNASLLPASMREVFPLYQDLEKKFETNPWLFFIYYLTRVDILSAIEKEPTK
jgi:hypothetical protein